MGGNTGTGGVGNSGGTGVKNCDPTPIFTTKACANPSCHDAMGTSANFDMASAGWQTHLVGVNPKGGGALASVCGANGPYLVTGMLPARGLFLDKMKDGPMLTCGVVMPFAGTKLSPTEFDCVQTWANTLVATSSTATSVVEADDDGEGP
jgi:hypothetical protein